MQIITSPEEMRSWSHQQSLSGGTIGFVPTMGFFHEGHLSLMRMAAKQTKRVVVSVFVNPIQFGLHEDLDKYPQDLDRDSALAKDENVDVLFIPDVRSMYPEPTETKVSVSGLSECLCGLSRPEHFDGVCTVVNKLFNIVNPDLAFFGSKDFQQLAVIKRMVTDLNIDVGIVAHPTVREKDGLAMSSRNSYLNVEERKSALSLYKAIVLAKDLIATGHSVASDIVEALEVLINSHDNVDIEYLSIVNCIDLQKQKTLDDKSILMMAVKVGNTRLIDNYLLHGNTGDI
jgi:pantoate--beta-alanine ligase